MARGRVLSTRPDARPHRQRQHLRRGRVAELRRLATAHERGLAVLRQPSAGGGRGRRTLSVGARLLRPAFTARRPCPGGGLRHGARSGGAARARIPHRGTGAGRRAGAAGSRATSPARADRRRSHGRHRDGRAPRAARRLRPLLVLLQLHPAAEPSHRHARQAPRSARARGSDPHLLHPGRSAAAAGALAPGHPGRAGEPERLAPRVRRRVRRAARDRAHSLRAPVQPQEIEAEAHAAGLRVAFHAQTSDGSLALVA